MLVLFKNYAENTVSQQVEKLLFFYFSSLMMTGALTWGFLCLYFGYRMPSLVPFGYVVITLINFYICTGDSKSRVGITCQVFASILLPFLFQYMLGGVANSGFVMLWSVLALLGAMIFQEKQRLHLWIGLFLALSIFTFIHEAGLKSEDEYYGIPILLTAINVIMVSLMIFGLGHYFVKIQNDLRTRLSHQRKSLKESNEKIENDLLFAKGFQEVLLSSKGEILTRHLEFKRIKNHVSGTFHWTGNILNKQVIVFVENPDGGAVGAMQAMLLWNIIENAIYRSGIRKPDELVTYIQKELYSRYNFPLVSEKMKQVGLTVVLYNNLTSELDYASVDTTFVIGSQNEQRVVNGFQADYFESKETSTDAKMVSGSTLIDEKTRLLFCNQAILDALNISSDSDLMNPNKEVSMVLSESFVHTKRVLKKVLDPVESEQDLFLICVELF